MLFEFGSYSVSSSKRKNWYEEEVHMDIKVKIQLGDCGMGMPVIRSWQAMKKLSMGDVLQMSSSHPWAEPDIKAWCKASGHELLQIVMEEQERHFFVRCTK